MTDNIPTDNIPTENLPQEKTALQKQIEDLSYEVWHIRDPVKSKSDNWSETADQWWFRFKNDMTFDFYTGVGHRNRKRDWGGNILTFPVKPKIDSLLASLVSDSVIAGQSFEWFCADLGMDTDSRKALETYLACQESAGKLAKLGFRDLAALQEHYQDY